MTCSAEPIAEQSERSLPNPNVRWEHSPRLAPRPATTREAESRFGSARVRLVREARRRRSGDRRSTRDRPHRIRPSAPQVGRRRPGRPQCRPSSAGRSTHPIVLVHRSSRDLRSYRVQRHPSHTRSRSVPPRRQSPSLDGMSAFFERPCATLDGGANGYRVWWQLSRRQPEGSIGNARGRATPKPDGHRRRPQGHRRPQRTGTDRSA